MAGQYIYGQILNKLSLEEAIKVAKSKNILAKAALLYYPWDLSREEVCLAFKDIDLSVLLKNTSINRTDLFSCSIALKNEVLAHRILSIARNNTEEKEYQVYLTNYNKVIVDASGGGLTDLVKVLLDVYDLNPSYNHNLAIKLAFKNGHDSIVDLLLESPKFNYEDTDLIILALTYQAEDVLIKIVKRVKFKGVIHSKWMYTIFFRSLYSKMFKLIAYMVNNGKIATEQIQLSVSNLVKKSKKVSIARKVMKILVDKYRNPHDPNVYPQFIFDIISESIYNLSMFKMTMKETKIDPGYNDNILLRLAANTTFNVYGMKKATKVVEYLLTRYKDQVDPSVMNFKVFWVVYANHARSISLYEVLNLIIDHPMIKHNPKLDATVLSKIYKYKK